MTVPLWFLFLCAICIAARAMFGLAGIREDCKRRALLDNLWDDEVDA